MAYKISEFSKITSLTVKALRYYDEEGLLKPSLRGENGYRYYTIEDYQKAQLIVTLKELEFSIAEIKEVVVSLEDASDLTYYLEEKREMIKKKIEKEKILLKKLDDYMAPLPLEEIEANYKVVMKEVEPVKVAAIRYQGRYGDVGQHIGTIFKEMKGKPAGEPFNCYFDEAYMEIADMMLCVPITGDTLQKETTIEVLPKERMLSTIHTGSYDTLSRAYKVLLDYAKSHHLICKVPSREIYHKGPGMIFKGNPSKYVTEIMIPFEEETKDE